MAALVVVKKHRGGELVKLSNLGRVDQGSTERGSMKTTVRTEAEAVRASVRKLLKPGWYDDVPITDALEKVSRAGKDCIELTSLSKTEFSATGSAMPTKERSSCATAAKPAAMMCSSGTKPARSGKTIFPVIVSQVKIGVQKGNRNFPGDRNVIEDYRAPADSRVVNLRTG